MTRFLALVFVASGLVGCATVQPWERGTLSSDRMSLDPNPDELAMTASRRRTREEGTIQGGGSASGSAGGGCGCH